jgi:hypothetical protein
MNNARENRIAARYSERSACTLYQCDGNTAPQGADRQAGREYLPMDVFVDPKTMRQHFQSAWIRASLTGVHAATG